MEDALPLLPLVQKKQVKTLFQNNTLLEPLMIIYESRQPGLSCCLSKFGILFLPETKLQLLQGKDNSASIMQLSPFSPQLGSILIDK